MKTKSILIIILLEIQACKSGHRTVIEETEAPPNSIRTPHAFMERGHMPENCENKCQHILRLVVLTPMCMHTHMHTKNSKRAIYKEQNKLNAGDNIETNEQLQT